MLLGWGNVFLHRFSVEVDSCWGMAILGSLLAEQNKSSDSKWKIALLHLRSTVA